jgi:hypothetical protein
MRLASLMAALGLCALAGVVHAYEFQPLGFESIGMGGAGVANARGSMAGYYNPALLTRSPHLIELTLGGGVGVREFNLAENIDRLDQLDLNATLQRIANNAATPTNNTASDRRNILTAQQRLQSLSQGNHLALMPSAALGVQISNIGFGVYASSDATAQAIIAPGKIDLIVAQGGNFYEYTPGDPNDASGGTYSLVTQAEYNQRSLEDALFDRETYLALKGLALVEAPISHARRYNILVGNLSVGSSVKVMQGMTYTQQLDIATNSDELEDAFDNVKETDTQLGFDAGLLFQPILLKNLTVGVVGKNLNSPEFAIAGGGVVTVDPMYRAGAAYCCWNNKLDFAVDYDLTDNARGDGKVSRYLGGGVNYHPASWFSLRAGAMQNTADPDETGTILTAGVGLGLKWVQLDLSAMMAQEKGSYEGDEIPRYMKLNAALVSRW